MEKTEGKGLSTLKSERYRPLRMGREGRGEETGVRWGWEVDSSSKTKYASGFRRDGDKEMKTFM